MKVHADGPSKPLPPHADDFDAGTVPWVLTTMAWLAVPFVPFPLLCMPAAMGWTVLLLVAITAALVLLLFQALRGSPLSPFARKALRSAGLQLAVVGLLFLVVRSMR